MLDTMPLDMRYIQLSHIFVFACSEHPPLKINSSLFYKIMLYNEWFYNVVYRFITNVSIVSIKGFMVINYRKDIFVMITWFLEHQHMFLLLDLHDTKSFSV